MNILPAFDSQKEEKNITTFIQSIIQKTKINKFVIGISGGIDSAVSFILLSKVVPPEQIYAVHLYYQPKVLPLFREVTTTVSLPPENIIERSIKNEVDTIVAGAHASGEKLRTGNIMARVRMIMLFDLSKKHNALVCGTENKSEGLLGYFTRFGDAASDLEPISHLYKTQVFSLAEYLNVPRSIIKAAPTAGLWEGQTDEKELGFSYEEADQVLYLYFEKKETIETLQKRFEYAEKIIQTARRNAFKQEVPYKIL